MRILALSCIRDEAPSIVDWVAHHRAVGVTDFLIFTNDCTDGSEAMLDALAPAGVVHVRQGAARGASPAPQWRAMAAAWDHPLRRAADWAVHLDVDEYICPFASGGLAGLVGRVADADAIALPWRLFGHAGRMSADAAPVPERFDRAAPEGVAYPPLANFFKTLFSLTGPFEGFGIHRPRQSRAPRLVDDCGVPRPDVAADPGRILLPRAGRGRRPRLAQLNHYSVRSVEEFLGKRARGLSNRTGKSLNLTYWVERNFNTVQDRSMTPHLPALHAEAARLRSLPGVAEAETRGRAWHRAQVAEILATPEGARLAGRLWMASGSLVPEGREGARLLSLLARSMAQA